MPDRNHVIIIGGGFGGLYTAKEIGGDKSIDVTLVDKRNFHLFQPLLYQVATGGLSPGDISSPLRAVLNRFKNIRVICDELIDLDPQNNEVVLKQSRL
jgi:NADH dehydrogenase